MPSTHAEFECKLKFNALMSPDPQDHSKEERLSRIVAASLEVFAEFSFQDATTGEIARRARVSKRDIYAHFPNKHALLIGTMNDVLRTNDDNIVKAIAHTECLPSLPKRLVVIGFTLINEVLSLEMSVMLRLVTSESINQPLIGAVFFENGPARRAKLISEVLSMHTADPDTPVTDIFQAAEHYLALVTYQPRLSTLVGMRDMWDFASIQTHVESAVECFLRAHAEFA